MDTGKGELLVAIKISHVAVEGRVPFLVQQDGAEKLLKEDFGLWSQKNTHTHSPHIPGRT